MVKTLLRYYGGQLFKMKKLREFIPMHKTFVEVFGGAGHFIILKEPSEVEIYNDIDRNLVDFFRVLQDEEKYKKLIWKLKWTLYSREEYYLARSLLSKDSIDDITRAWALYVASRQSFGGSLLAGWSFDKTVSRDIESDFYDQTWYEREFAIVRRRFRNVQVDCDDWRVVLDRYDGKETFFFLDPPYPPSTVRTRKQYINTMSEEDHIELSDWLKKLDGKFLLITYRTDYYDSMGVNTYDIPSKLHTSSKPTKITVFTRVYYNYNLNNKLI